MTPCTFSLMNPQEEDKIGTTTLSREYKIKCNSSLFIPRCFNEDIHELRPVLLDGFSPKSLLCVTTYVQLLNNSLLKL